MKSPASLPRGARRVRRVHPLGPGELGPVGQRSPLSRGAPRSPSRRGGPVSAA